ncbi:MAG TPA: UTRA domain-containing protein, partial [Ktedonobacteraceae bacterium]|nr:UTRA domain-containing protein [Ktedonobacteraceae bacterium]
RPHYYKKSEVLALRSGEPLTQREPIIISGIFGDWTLHLRSRGYQAITTTQDIEQVTLPEEVRNTFHIPAERQFIRRSRMTLANGVPICTWSTYYPLELVQEKILDEMKRDSRLDIVKHIKEEHGIAPRWEKNRYTARSATLEEQETLKLLTNEPVLILQRGCWTDDRQTLTHVSHMTLLASWFAIEHDFPVSAKVWDGQKESDL